MSKRKKRKKTLEKIQKTLPLRHTVHSQYIRLKSKFPIWFVLNNTGNWQLTIASKRVKMWSLRYINFKTNGTVCVICGLTGQYFRLERHALGIRKSYHFNLYALNTHGNEVLMTKDHIIPKSKGGSNNIENLQTLCTRCNNKKSNS